MSIKCILINPWIYDFAAVNLWARPLGLIKVAEHLSQLDVQMHYIDCMDVVYKKKRYGMGNYPSEIVEKPFEVKKIPRYFKRYGIPVSEFISRLKELLPCNVIFITSVMSYWYPGAQKAIELMKTIAPQTPIILGGIYATLYPEHASRYSGADHIYRGHIHEDIITQLEVLGISLKKESFRKPYYRLHLYPSLQFAPVLTSYGCPYHCSYCASSLLHKGFEQRDSENIFDEIAELYRMGVRDFAFYDDALLVKADTHIKIILEKVIAAKLKLRFHCPNGLHARFIDNELAYLMKKSGFKTIRLSLETSNEKRQEETGGKVTSTDFRKAVLNLKKQGFSKKEIGTYLMYGLPGQVLKEVKDGIDFIKNLGVKINLTEFSPIPGTKCWEELNDMGIITDSLDPLLTNNTVFSQLFSGYDTVELEKLKLDVKQWNFASL